MGAYPVTEQDKIREIDRLRARVTVLETTVAKAADNLDAYGYPQTAAALRDILNAVEDHR